MSKLTVKDFFSLPEPIPRDPAQPIVIPPASLDLNDMSMAEAHGDPRIWGGKEPSPMRVKYNRDVLQSIDKQYLLWLRKIYEQGETRTDRTGTGTISLFGEVQMRADLRVEFPALTTKYTHFPAVDDELDWMKSGSTNIRSMKKNGTRIWDEWVKPGTEEFRIFTTQERILKLSNDKQADLMDVVEMMKEDYRTDARILEVKLLHLMRAGIPERELIAGELGPVYGDQWRHWEDTRIIEAREWQADPQGWQDRGFHVAGKMYDGHRIAITRKIDQIAQIEKALASRSDSRRIILSGWNVAKIDEMALPPCHAFAQWFVSSEKDEDGKHFLDCEMFQRSGDFFLGIPFNMAQYALLTSQLAYVHGLRARYFTHTIGDAHIYSNHVEQVKQQLGRTIKHSHPQLEITGEFNSILEMKTGDCKLVGYEHYPAIKAPVAV